MLVSKKYKLYLNVATVLSLLLSAGKTLYCTSMLTLPHEDFRGFQNACFLILLCSLSPELPTPTVSYVLCVQKSSVES